MDIPLQSKNNKNNKKINKNSVKTTMSGTSRKSCEH